MIIRPEQHWFLRLFDWHGSVLSKIIFRLLLNVLMSIIAIISYQWYEQLGIHLTVAPFSLLGIAIAIFLGFRNSASYSRFVEARNLWGTVLIAEPHAGASAAQYPAGGTRCPSPHRQLSGGL